MAAVARTRRVIAAAAARAARVVTTNIKPRPSGATAGSGPLAWRGGGFAIEPLESRELLTVVTGTAAPGVTHFDFNDASGSPVRVDVQGNIKVELIGENSDAFGNVGLNNLPGDLTTPAGRQRVFGGRGGVKGVYPVTALNANANPPTVNPNAAPATTTIQDIPSIPDPLGATDPQFANSRVGGDDGLGTFTGAEVPSQLVNLDGLASNGAGQTFAFNVVTVPVANGQRILVQLVQIDNTTGRAVVVEDLNRDSAPFTTQSANDLSRFGGYLYAPFTGTTIPAQVLPTITAADFSPTDDTKLYFVATVQVVTGPTAAITAPRLFVYDFTKPLGHRVSPVNGSFGSLFAGQQAVSTVSGISFNPNDGSLWVLATVPNNPQNKALSLFRLAPGFTNTDAVTQGGTPVAGITGTPEGIEFLGSGPGDINNDPTGVYVLTDSALFRTDISRTINVGGVQEFGSVNLGPLPDPDDNRTPPRGTNVHGITYNPTLLNPFFLTDDPTSRRRGVFLGTDAGTDELLFIDFRNRFPASNLFTIYVTLNDPNGSTTDGKISISRIVFNSDGTVSYTPYNGSVTFNSGFFATPPTVTVGQGDVFVGALNAGGFPVNSAATPTTNTFALLPHLTSASPGLITAPGVNLDSFLLGGTITGQVYIANSINTMYVGALATGNASGGVVGTFSETDSAFVGNFGFLLDAPAIDNPANFYVGGDMRDLIVAAQAGIVGDALNPNTNFYTQMDVEGRTGQIRVGAESGIRGVFKGQDRAQGMPGFIMQRELEEIGPTPRTDVEEWQRFRLSQDDPGAPGFFRNDKIGSAQYLGTINTNALGPDLESRNNVIQLRGKMEPGNVAIDDPLDNYGIGLMAGQVYSFQVVGMSDTDPQTGAETTDVTKWTYNGTVGAVVRLFDPDGRLVASNGSFVDPGSTLGSIFSYKADRPGIYTVQIDSGGGFFPYELTAFNVGKTALGAYHATGAIGDPRSSLRAPIVIANSQTSDTPGIETGDGDLGIFQTEGEMVSFTTNFLTADNGNIRVLQALDMGRITTTPIPAELGLIDFHFGIDIFAPHGSVGLVKNTDTTQASLISLNRNDLQTTADVTFTGQVFGQSIGGDYQEIQSPGGFFGNLLANGNIGVIQVGDLATFQSTFAANFDQSGAPGVIDLISTTGSSRNAVGSFGTLGFGGPALSTGPGGNVRYIVPNDYRNIFVDNFFGGGSPIETTYTTGVSATFVDDSGSVITAIPSNLGQNPAFNPLAPPDPLANPQFLGEGALSAITYPVRGSGGSVLVRLISTTGLALESSAARASNASVEIGRIEVSAALSQHDVVAVPVDRLGRVVLGVAVQATNGGYALATTTGTNAAGQTVTVRGSVGTLTDGVTSATAVATAILLRPGPAGTVVPGTPVGTPGTFLGTNVTMDGSASIDVFNLVQNDPAGTALDTISNSTGGEIVNASLVSVGTIQSAGNLGIGKSSTGTLVRTTTHVAGGAFPSALYPLDAGQPFGIVATGNIAVIRSSRAIGNLVVGTFSGNTNANVTLDVGNIGELSANYGGSNNANAFEGIAGNVFTSGRINTINLGEGLAPTGTGAVSQAGIYALGEIGLIQNTNSRGDIRGTVASATDIISINLHDANIVDSLIITPISIASANLFGLPIALSNLPGSTFDLPLFQIGSINVSGDGGIIGSAIIGQNIGPITVSRFLFDSMIGQAGGGVQGDINVGGYGIRAVSIQAFSAGTIAATGNGSQLSTDNVSSSVRRSEGDLLTVDGNQLDPFFLSEPSRLTDIHAFLGTSSAVTTIPNVTNTGVIEDMDARFARDVGTIRAWQIRGSQPAQVRNPNLPIQIFPTTGAATIISAGNSIGTISTLSTINGLQVTTGNLKTFHPGSDVLDTQITVSSKLTSLTINGSLANNSIIQTVGPNSTIGTINIKGNLDGRIQTTGRVGTITIGGNLNGAIVITATNFGKSKNALDKLVLNGFAVTGSFQITGNVGSITAANSLGQSGDQITITGNLGSLTVGSNKRTNANLAANLTVNGTLGTLKVTGRVDGAIHVLGNLNKFTLTNDAASRGTNFLTNSFRVDGQLKSVSLSGGSLSSTSFSAFNIGKLSIKNGNVAPLALISSDSSIQSFSIKGGSLLGSLLAGGGTIKSASVSGNVGNGVNPLTVQAFNLNKFKIGGSVFSQVTINVPGTLGDLEVGGEIQSGATVDAGVLRKIHVRGANHGTINVG